MAFLGLNEELAHSHPAHQVGDSGRWRQDALCGQRDGLLSALCLFAAIEHISDPVNWTRI